MEDNSINPVDIVDTLSSGGILALALEADIVVKIVMIVLVVASVWCWAVILDKSVRLMRLNRKTNTFERAFWSGTPLDDLYKRIVKHADHPMALMFVAGMEEWREAPRSSSSDSNQRLIGRVGRVMDLTLDREISALEKHLPWLATVGSTAPFVGLFGTVWGIMNSFQSIALTKNTTLAVVAPGIAEALFATALGLLAAIPAVVAYNRFSVAVDRLSDRLTSFGDEFGVVVSREIDTSRVVS